jgi:hypothetical protein
MHNYFSFFVFVFTGEKIRGARTSLSVSTLDLKEPLRDSYTVVTRIRVFPVINVAGGGSAAAKL